MKTGPAPSRPALNIDTMTTAHTLLIITAAILVVFITPALFTKGWEK